MNPIFSSLNEFGKTSSAGSQPEWDSSITPCQPCRRPHRARPAGGPCGRAGGRRHRARRPWGRGACACGALAALPLIDVTRFALAPGRREKGWLAQGRGNTLTVRPPAGKHWQSKPSDQSGEATVGKDGLLTIAGLKMTGGRGKLVVTAK